LPVHVAPLAGPQVHVQEAGGTFVISSPERLAGPSNGGGHAGVEPAGDSTPGLDQPLGGAGTHT
jgi:hypothetical protein